MGRGRRHPRRVYGGRPAAATSGRPHPGPLVNDYPSQSPWGPHGPQVSVPSVMPNPTAPSATPDFGGWLAPSSAPASFSGGGVGFVGGSAGGTATFTPQ